MKTNNIAHIKAGKSIVRSEELRDLRKRYDLDLIEAATALGVPESVFAAWEEQGDGSRNLPNITFLENCMIAYSRKFKPIYGGKNKIFGIYPLHVGRDLLSLDRLQMAAKYGGSSETWKKYECNQRTLSGAIIKRIEEDVRNRFALVCSNLDSNIG